MIKSMNTTLQIRSMTLRDMSQVLEIERRSFRNPWTREEFQACLRSQENVGVVIEHSAGSIHGFMIYSLGGSQIEILDLAVAPEVRKTGVGTALLGYLRVLHGRFTNGLDAIHFEYGGKAARP